MPSINNIIQLHGLDVLINSEFLLNSSSFLMEVICFSLPWWCFLANQNFKKLGFGLNQNLLGFFKLNLWRLDHCFPGAWYLLKIQSFAQVLPGKSFECFQIFCLIEFSKITNLHLKKHWKRADLKKQSEKWISHCNNQAQYERKTRICTMFLKPLIGRLISAATKITRITLILAYPKII